MVHRLTSNDPVPASGKAIQYCREDRDWLVFFNGQFVGARDTAQQAESLANEAAMRALESAIAESEVSTWV